MVMPLSGRSKTATARTGSGPAPAAVPQRSNVVALDDHRPVTATGEPDHGWLLGHVMQLARYCERNGLGPEEAVLAEAVDRLMAGAGRKSGRV